MKVCIHIELKPHEIELPDDCSFETITAAVRDRVELLDPGLLITAGYHFHKAHAENPCDHLYRDEQKKG